MSTVKELGVLIDTNIFFNAIKGEDEFSHLILRVAQNGHFVSYTSKDLIDEATQVAKNQDIPLSALRPYLEVCKLVDLDLPSRRLRKLYGRYVYHDSDNSVAGAAIKGELAVILTSNTKHFDAEALWEEYGCQVLPPEEFLKLLLHPADFVRLPRHRHRH